MLLWCQCCMCMLRGPFGRLGHGLRPSSSNSVQFNSLSPPPPSLSLSLSFKLSPYSVPTFVSVSVCLSHSFPIELFIKHKHIDSPDVGEPTERQRDSRLRVRLFTRLPRGSGHRPGHAPSVLFILCGAGVSANQTEDSPKNKKNSSSGLQPGWVEM